ncbi:MAG: DUF1566 domain-containing protein [Bacteroidales bacterium]|nr:DUF1566 domain-containing protein [Bacteroidales bacterium]
MKKFFYTTMVLLSVLAINCTKEPDPDPQKDAALTKKYEIGELYNVNGVKGIVFDISDGGLHGLILSLDEYPTTLYDNNTFTMWCTSVMNYIGLKDTVSGLTNAHFLKYHNIATDSLTVIHWCESRNTRNQTGWYLPAQKELQKLEASFQKDGITVYTLNVVREALTEIVKKGVHKEAVELRVGNYSYWTSSEIDAEHVWGVRLSSGKATPRELRKDEPNLLARAVRRF